MRRTKGKFPHIEFLELEPNVSVECAVMREYPNGDLAYIKLMDLDNIDKKRLLMILSKDSASHLPLWKLMESERLNNGINALEYFHQLTKVRLVSGKLVDTNSGQYGLAPINSTVQLEPVESTPKRGTKQPTAPSAE